MNNVSSADRKEVLRHALAVIDELQKKLDASEHALSEPIAIVGVGCRLPGGAVDLSSLWRLLRDGIDATGDIPTDRWDLEAFYDADPEAPGKIYIRRGGFLDQVDLFDAHFFGIAPREALSMDPQHRLALEVAWETLENAGQNPEQLIGSRTGVFIGITTNDYAQLLKANGPGSIGAYHFTGNHPNFVAGRIAYLLGLQGPTMAVDTACSSSLVAVHLACQSLRGRECDLALAGGVNLILSPLENITICKARMLAADGRCKSFDAHADGYARGEGCGMVALKRLSDAQANGDTVYALILGSAVNQDGASSGLTVPNATAQQDVIREAVRRARIQAEQVSYVETHGTGTALGDPIEVRALNAVLGKNRAKAHPLKIGTVKTNIGHLESAAGIAGLIKVLSSLQHQEIPPIVNLKQLNPAVDWEEIPVVVPTERTPWTAEGNPRIGGLSSFGASGTNAHLILQEAPHIESAPEAPERPIHLLALSAKSPEALKEMAARYHRYLLNQPAASLMDVCFTANAGRKHFPYRQVFIADHAQSMAQVLQTFAKEGDAGISLPPARRAQAVFLFTGQGSQYVGMGHKLYDSQPVFRQALETCDKLLRVHMDRPLLSILYPTASGTTAIDETLYTQPALFALEYALAKLWQSWGIEPAAVMGHSVGEYVAACIAGVFSLEDGLALIAQRARLMNSLPKNGAMAVVMADEQQVLESIVAYPEEIALAAVNGPDNVVISGASARVQAVAEGLETRGIHARPLNVSHAFHSPLMTPILDAFEKAAQSVGFRKPRIPLISNVTGNFFNSAEIPDAHYWRRHIRRTVRFAEGMRALSARSMSYFLEVGPQPVLLGMGRRCLPDDAGTWRASLKKGRDDWKIMLESLADLYRDGFAVDWQGFDRGYARHRVALPSYPFQRKRYWAIGKPTYQPHSQPLHPLLHTCSRSPLMKEILFESNLDSNALAYLKDHVVYGMMVFPAAAYIEMALGLAHRILGDQTFQIEDLVLHRALILPEEQTVRLQMLFTPSDSGGGAFRIISTDQNSREHTDRYVLHAEGRIVIEDRQNSPAAGRSVALQALRRRCSHKLKAEDYYDVLARRGLQFGPSFRGISHIWHNSEEGLGEIRLPGSLEREVQHYRIHPVLLDACFQVCGITWPGDSDADAYLPISIGRFRLYDPPSPHLWSHFVCRPGYQANSETASGDVRVFSDAGQLVAEIEALTVKRSKSTALVAETQKDLDSLVYEIQWLPEDRAGRGTQASDAASLPMPEKLATHIAPHVADLAARNYLSIYDELFPQLDTLCTDYILKAFRDLGWNPVGGDLVHMASFARQLGVAGRHTLMLGRLFDILAEDGLLDREGSGFRISALPKFPDPEEKLRMLLDRYPEACVELKMTAHFGRNLASGLRGESDPLELLFPGGAVESAEELYQDAPYFRFYNCLMQETAAVALSHLPHHRTVRILEIGAGTGGTTSHILNCLPSDRTEYVFTDVSNLFLKNARKKFARYPFIRYQIMDIEKAPQDQGIDSERFDLVFAANVLHATADLRQTLTNAQKLLVPGGMLVLLEAVRLQRFADLIVGLTAGWWRFSDRDLRPSHALMPSERWIEVLAQSGFEGACTLKGKELTAGAFAAQAIILARKPRIDADQATPGAGLPNRNTKWLVFNDRQGVGAHLAKHLAIDDQPCTWVTPGEHFKDSGDGQIVLNPGKRDQFDRLIDTVFPNPVKDRHGVIFLWALDAECEERCSIGQAEAQQRFFCGAALFLVQAMVNRGCTLSGFWLVTRGAQWIGPAFRANALWQAPLWGFGRTVAAEHPELNCRLVDLDVSDPSIASQALASELARLDVESQVAWREQTRYCARLMPKKHPVRREETTRVKPLRVVNTTPGILDGVRLEPMTRHAPASGEVEIRVQAAALNFRDVLMAMNMYPGQIEPFGIECAGRIETVGEDVQGWNAGDAVIAIASGSFSTFVTADARLVAGLPQGISETDASTIPSVFLTADYALIQLAKITSQDRILIHAAAGGVGLAAIQFAQKAGAEIYATAGNPEKRDFVKSLGIKHVMDSRTLAFADEIMTLTDGQGVDVVLNCLSGDFIAKSLSILAPKGRFIELGRRDIWKAEQVAQAREDVSYFVVNVLDTCRKEPFQMGGHLKRLAEAFEQKQLVPLPKRVLPLSRAADGFRYMAQAKHIGKIVFENPDVKVAQPVAVGPTTEGQHVKLDGSGAYLITGGLGGLGLEVARWLLRQGARKLFLMGRSAPHSRAVQAIAELRSEGAQVAVIQGDVAEFCDLERIRSEIEQAHLSLRGVFHCAGVLADNVLEKQDWQRFAAVMAPKVSGSWNLHLLTREMPVDQFVMFSSVVSVLGSAGQANHAAACAFEDALAHYRRAQGLAGLSINWGPWSSVGAVVTHHVGERLRTRGIRTISPQEGLQLMQRIMQTDATQVTALRADWQQFMRHFGGDRRPALLTEIKIENHAIRTVSSAEKIPSLIPQLENASPKEVRRILQNHVRETVIQVFGLEPSTTIDLQQGLSDIGMDSLMSLELRNRLQVSTGQALPSTLAFDCPTVGSLVTFLSDKLLTPVPNAAKRGIPEKTVRDEKTAAMEHLTDEEAEALLLAELSKKQD